MTAASLARGLRACTLVLATAGMTLQPTAAMAQAGGDQAASAPVVGVAPGEPRRLGGIWQMVRFSLSIADAPLLPDAKQLYDGQRTAMKDGQILYTAWTSCRPGAVSSMVMGMNSMIVLEGEHDITLSFEEPRMTRRIRMNAEHPADLKPSYLGDSVGHWEGDTLVVDTIGYNGQFQIDTYGLPSSDKLHTVERLTKTADGTRVNIETTIEDPEYYSAPMVLQRAWVPDTARHQFEYDCMENPRVEEFAHTHFVKELYRPACVRFEGQGLEASKILCRKPEEQAEAIRKLAEKPESTE